jgi:predicted HAD superfamily Cof-like phosphohydrolase
MSNFDDVSLFMRSFGQQVLSSPILPEEKIKQLRYELIREEVEELADALEDNNIVEVADALTDILYVVYGAGHAFGIDLDKCFAEVQRSNMSKLGEDGKPILREDGKVLKGKTYSPPDLKTVLFGEDNEHTS